MNSYVNCNKINMYEDERKDDNKQHMHYVNEYIYNHEYYKNEN